MVQISISRWGSDLVTDTVKASEPGHHVQILSVVLYFVKFKKFHKVTEW